MLNYLGTLPLPVLLLLPFGWMTELLRTEVTEMTNAHRSCGGRCRMRSRRWPTLPRPHERSTIGAVGLNDRVRNGNGCGPYALTASNFVCEKVKRQGRRECAA